VERFGLHFLVGALLITTGLVFFIFQPFLIAIIMAAVFAVVLNPVYEFVSRSMPRWPSVAALITVTGMFILVLVPLTTIAVQIGTEATTLYTALTEGSAQGSVTALVSRIESVLVTHVPGARGVTSEFASHISEYSESGLRWLLQNMGSAFSGIASFFVSLFVFVIALYYLLRDGAHLTDKLVAISPLKDADDRSIATRLERAVNSVIKGTLFIALLQGLLAGIGFWLFGMPNSVLWGTVAAVAALIPGLGTALIFIPAVIYLGVISNVPLALGLALWGAIVVGGVDNIVRPYLIGNGTSLHPLPVLLSVLGGITFFGPVGIFLGPLSIALFFALLSIYSDNRHYQA
jgi:predicted PurR-regulated permease PerM